MMLQNVHKEFKVPYFGYFIHNVYEHTILTLTRYRKSVNTRKYRFGLYLLFLETCCFFYKIVKKVSLNIYNTINIVHILHTTV